MTEQQPEALQLADELLMNCHVGTQKRAAAELRRLHAENERLWADNSALAANQCLVANGIVGNDGGTPYCTLRAEVERADAQRDRFLGMNKTLVENVESLRAEVERKSDAIQRIWKERDELRAEVESLRSALEVTPAPLHMEDAVWAIEQHRAEVESLRADAARYRWLRDNPWPSPDFVWLIQMHLNEMWDEAIDAAMRGEA